MCSRMCMCARPGCAERLVAIAERALNGSTCNTRQRIDAKRIMLMSGTATSVRASQRSLEIVRTPIRESDDLTTLAETFGVLRDRRPAPYTVRVVEKRGQR